MSEYRKLKFHSAGRLQNDERTERNLTNSGLGSVGGRCVLETAAFHAVNRIEESEMNIENDSRSRGVKIEEINTMKDKAVYGISLIEKIEDIELQYEIDDLKRIGNYQKGKLVVTLNLLIAVMGIALATVGLAIMNGKGFDPWMETLRVFSEQLALIALIVLVIARFGAWIWFTHSQFKKADEFARRKRKLFEESDAILRALKAFRELEV